MELAGSVVGIISFAIQTTECLIRYYTSVKDSKVNCTLTIQKLKNLASILQDLLGVFRGRKFKPHEKDLLHSIESAVRECEGHIQELHNEAKKFSESSSSSTASFARLAVRRVSYPLRESTLQKLSVVIDRICSNLSLALQVLNLEDSATLRDGIRDCQKMVNIERTDRLLVDLRRWLKSSDASAQYNDIISKQYPNTGKWFVKGPALSSWLAKPNSFLWLNGQAGCGKTVLASGAIQRVLSLRQSNPTVGVAYFYFAFKDTSKQTTVSMLCAVVQQLLNQVKPDSPAVGQLDRLMRANHDDTPPPESGLLSVLRTLVKQFNNTYIILDGLDECPRKAGRGRLLKAIEEIRHWADSRLHLLVSSRNEPDIRGYLRPATHEEVKVSNVDLDIETYVTGTLRNDRSLERMRQFHPLIQGALISRAEGSFRWVECMLNALESCPVVETRVKNLFSSVPFTLCETYERMLLDVDQVWAKDARKILTLLCSAKRPLTIAEVDEALRMGLGPEDILLCCPGLVVVDRNNVKLVHSSVREYLQSEHLARAQSHASNFRVCSVPAQRVPIRSW
ncbi:hypothetical protein QBC41DRAFT_21492 [Cercophora samala]|uniref:NACHT domain-containing protein n=1 Tax=Cercophora samala TaxID=330535 RepID=A0AA39Z4M2_9PEZI|nr:hypothetical protein QBC41DRAFT_21492 [Cercophora samala]